MIVKPFFHRKQESISLHGDFNDSLVRGTKGIKWSRTYRCWYIPCDENHFNELRSRLAGKAEIDHSELAEYLRQRKALVPSEKKVRESTFKKIQGGIPNAANLEAYEKYMRLLAMKSYSPSTVSLYSNAFHRVLRVIGQKPIDSLSNEELHGLLLWFLQVKGCTEHYMHVLINAMKFYFEKVLGRDPEHIDLPRPRKPLQLPVVLAEEEVVKMMESMENIKHRCILMTAYSGGLRVSEVVSLKLKDIDSKRMLIHVRRAKGKKDRMVPLSRRLLLELREYFLRYKPKEFLFEGQDGGAYSTRSAQQILKDAKLKAGITKPGGMHSLRHSYATHLIESGTDIRYIQELLGHQNVMTTMRYTHVSKSAIGRIESPLDKLDFSAGPSNGE